ncbi:hypothetical protein M5K25_009625 [Dendrobium thyrsiflorum]|uniref:ASCH domain-containing protein n=1 Tax=Dendrobium thyrsiflorum TaxID=117978 RepID=A0ABD0V5Y6_DENTH
MNGKGSGGSGRGGGRYRNPCLTMHQPWASLLIHGIKRIEGRSWPAPLTGRLWIHAASKVPEPDTIKAMEKFYREIYAVDGVTDIKFPEHYPVSRLLAAEFRAGKEEFAEFFLRSEKYSSNFGFLGMTAKKVDALEKRLEGEMNQIKETVEERMSSMEGQVADLRDMMKKMLEFQTQSAASDAKGPEAKNTNSEIHREEEEVEIVEGRRGRPHLEPFQREERGGGYGERQGYGGMEPRGAGWEHREGYYGRRGAVFEDRRGDFEGCVEIVGCLRSEELDGWEEVPQSVRLEAFPGFCWLCEKPQKLIVPFEMRGYQGVYNLENKIYEAAVRGLTAIKSPLPVKFPLPDPQNSLSLKPGSLMSSSSKASEVEKSKSVSAAIAGARAAATQFARKDETRSAIKEPKPKTTKNQSTPVADSSNRTTYNLRSKGRIQEENQAENSEEKLMCVIEKTKTRNVIQHGSTKVIPRVSL